jgi:hypothetical protein
MAACVYATALFVTLDMLRHPLPLAGWSTLTTSGLDLWAATWSSHSVAALRYGGSRRSVAQCYVYGPDSHTCGSSRLFTDGTLHHNFDASVGQLVGRMWCGYRTLTGPLTYAFGNASVVLFNGDPGVPF